MGTPYGICNTVSCGTHMSKPIWVTNRNHMGPILDLARVAHDQPTFVEYISDLILYIFVLLNISTASTKL